MEMEMSELRQDIRFCTSSDGTCIAYATIGTGPPLVRAAHFLTHLEFDLKSPVVRPWLIELSRHNTLLHYDGRGTGLSDRDPAEITFEAGVADLEAVINAYGVHRFALFGSSQGSGTSIAYAARHPERVSHLVIYGGFARGLLNRNPSNEQLQEARAMLELMQVGWGRDNPAYRQIFTSQFIPDATTQQAAWFNEQERMSATPASAIRVIKSWGQIDVSDLARKVKCPTLVLHVRNDVRIPFDEGRLIASLIPGARFVPIEGRNHFLLKGEPGFAQMFAAIHDFLNPSRISSGVPDPAAAPELKQRLVAILAADAVGYSRKMARDERATINELDAARGIFRSLIESNQGRVIDMAGDSVLAVFETAYGAIATAIAAQESLASISSKQIDEHGMRFRIGVHLGDVIEKPDGTVYGDGVNVAARLQSLAEPGGIMASDLVYGVVRGKVDVAFADAGAYEVKNIARPIAAYRVRMAEPPAN
jgi:class 3 adenylate cyclase/pimeloyl-ACP methyl ester carboxylesterase